MMEMDATSRPFIHNMSQFQKEEGDFTYNGIDRIDNSLRHTIGNIVPCCWDCNRIKMALGLEEFLMHIVKINTHIMRLHGIITSPMKIDANKFIEDARIYVHQVLLQLAA